MNLRTPYRPGELRNQPDRVGEHNAWLADESLRWWTLRCAGGAPAPPVIEAIGARVGGHDLQDAARRANERPPVLAGPNGPSDVVFDDAWHRLLGAVLDSGVCGMPWTHAHGYVWRAAAFELWSRLDMGVMCPVSMTTAAVPVVERDPQLAGRWRDRLVGPRGERPALAGMAMTEPQGGSDLADSSTVADVANDGTATLTGLKWFCSHPVGDILLVLAREPGVGLGSRGLSCFAVTRILDDGSHNRWEITRLKDKLGTRSLASAELRLDGAAATRIGDPGDGVRTIIDMVAHTRMDCAIGSTGVMTRALTEAVAYASRRTAFGARLVDLPAMRVTLADLAIEREAALALALEIARSFGAGDAHCRLVTAIGKFWITRRAVAVCIEAVECLGGNGYTEEFDLARLYRDAQVNSTWEGSGNVIALDVLRTLHRDAGSEEALRAWCAQLVGVESDGGHPSLALLDDALALPRAESMARTIAGRVAIAIQSALLTHRACATGSAVDRATVEAFLATRCGNAGERVFGMDVDGALEEAAGELIDRYTTSTAEPL